MNVLGIRYGGHDSAATLMRDGKIVAASSQERHDYIKHSRAFPIDAARDCLKAADLRINDLDQIAFANDPIYHINEFYLKSALNNPERIKFLLQDAERIKTHYEMESVIREHTGFQGNIRFYRHHLCHLASAYYPSGFQEAVVASLDGMGEMETGLYAAGRDGKIEILHGDTVYPDSLGLIYSAITFYLGWHHHSDEGITMGLASYGDPHATISNTDWTYYDAFCEIIQEKGRYGYTINKDFIAYHKERDKWVSETFYGLMGPKRNYGDPIEKHHECIAAALQLRLETIVLKHLRSLRDDTGLNKLCIAGGVGLNCSMNGAIERSGIFDEIFVQPASGDDGSTLGACFVATSTAGIEIYPERDHNYYLGSVFTEDDIKIAIEQSGADYHKPDDLYRAATQAFSRRGNSSLVSGKSRIWTTRSGQQEYFDETLSGIDERLHQR